MDKDDNLRFVVQAFVANVWTVRETRVDADGNVTESRAYDKGLSDAFISANDTVTSPGFSVDEITKGLRDLGYEEQALGSQSTDETTLALIEAVAGAVDGVEHVTDARARWSGHRLLAELNVAVRPSLTVQEGHAIADDVHHALLHEVPRLADVMVHVDPHDHDPHG